MHSVDVAETTVRFAELLRRVQAGEEVVLTHENEPLPRRSSRGLRA